MTSVQIKEEIQKALNGMPETALPKALPYVRGLQTQPSEQLYNSLSKILVEDKGLLKRLAK